MLRPPFSFHDSSLNGKLIAKFIYSKCEPMEIGFGLRLSVAPWRSTVIQVSNPTNQKAFGPCCVAQPR